MTKQFPPSTFGVKADKKSGAAIIRARSALLSGSSLTRNPKDWRPRNGLEFDSLERRYLLSADISPYTDALEDGIDRLQFLVDELADFEEMSASVPILGESLSEAAQLSETLATELLDPLRSIISGLSAGNDINDLVTAIGGITGISTSDVIDTNDEASFDINFSTVFTNFGNSFDLGADASQLGISIDSTFDFQTTISFDFGFGILLDPALAPSEAVFVDDGSVLTLNGNANLEAAAGTDSLKVGLLGSANLDASTEFNLSAEVSATINETGLIDGRVTLGELDSSGLALIEVAVNGTNTGLTANLKVDSDGDIAGLTLNDAGITISLDGNFFEAPTLSVSIDTPDLADFSRLNAASLLSFFGDLGATLETLSTAFNEFASIDFIDINIGEYASFDTALRQLASSLSIPGLLGGALPDLDALIGLSESFDIQVTQYDPSLETQVAPVTETISLNLDAISTAVAGASDKLGELVAQINTAIGGSLGVEAFEKQGYVGIRATGEHVTDVVLLNVDAAITAVLGFQNEQTAFALPTFDTIQEFAAQLESLELFGGAVNLAYDAATSSLTFDLDINFDSAAFERTMSFNYALDLGLIGELALSGSADVAVDADMSFAFGAGFDLSSIDDAMLLEDLNGGAGIGTSPSGQPDLLIVTLDGASHSVDLSSIATIAELKAAISSGTGGLVTVGTDPSGSGLTLTDGTLEANFADAPGRTEPTFVIAGGEFSSAIYDLGFGFGIAAPDSSNTIGGASLIDRFFIDANSVASAGVSISIPDVDLYGAIGFVSVEIIDGSTTEDIGFSLDLSLQDVDNSDGLDRLYLSELGRQTSTDISGDVFSVPGVIFDVLLKDGSTASVDLSSATNVGEAITLLDTVTGMRAFLNANGTGVVLVDDTTGSEDFTVSVLNADPSDNILGFNLQNVDETGGDGILRGALLASDGFAALNSVDFDGAITGELVLPISFGEMGAALGLGEEGFDITIDFVQGSILPVIDTTGLDAILQALTSLGSADLLTLVGQIAGTLFDKIDALNADLPLLDASISDLVQLIQNGVDDLLAPVADKINDQLIFEISKALAYIDPSLVDDLIADAAAAGAFDDLTAFNDFAAVSSDFLPKLAGSDAGMLLIEAMEELRAQIRGLPGGFDLLFSDAPSKLISAFAAMRGALKKLQEEFSGDAGFLAELEDTFGNQLKVIEDIIPSTRTILRLVQEALGFELPRLDETLDDVADKLNGALKQALVDASDTVTDVNELTSKTIAEMIGLASELLDSMGSEVDTVIGDLIAQVQTLIDDGVDDTDIPNIDDIIPALEAVRAFLNDSGIPDSLADVVAKLADIAATGDNIFELIAEVPSITEMLAEIENQIGTLTGGLLIDLRAYLDGEGLTEDNLNAVLNKGLALVDRSVDEFRATVLGYFGGGLLQIGYTEGRYDVNLHIAPTLFEVDQSGLDFNFSVGSNLFSAGIEEGAILFELGGVIDLGMALQYNATSDTFGTDFDLLISEDTGFRLEAELTVNGALFVNLGGVGVQFAQETGGVIDIDMPSFTLTNNDKTGPAFFDIGVTGTATDGFIALADLGFDATAEARLFGEVFGFSKSGAAILWDHDGDAADADPTPEVLVDMGIDAAVTLSGGEFDFSFDANTLETGEITAILASLVDFSFENILEAFEQILDFVIDATDALSDAPLIGGPLDGLNTVLTDFRAAYEAFGDLLNDIDEDIDDIVGDIQKFIFDTFYVDFDFLNADLMMGNAGDVNVFEAEDILLDWVGGGGLDRELVLQPLHFGFTAENISVPFDFGLDALVFEIGADGEVTVDFNLNVVMGFGLSIQRGAYLVLPDLDEDGIIDPIFSGEFSAELDGEFSLSLFFLGVQAEVWNGLTADDEALREASGKTVEDFITDGDNQDAVGEGVSFSTALDLNILKGDGTELIAADTQSNDNDDLIIPILDLGDYGLGVDFEIDVDIDLFLRGGADLGGEFTVSNLPNITTFMNVDWMWSAGDDNFTAPGLQFYDLSLNLGEFVENALGPLLDFIDDFTAPLDPFFDFLDLEIPILSQLSQLFGQGALTVVDAISLLGSGIESIEVILQILDTIDAVTDFIESLSSGTLINFGDFIVSDPYGVTTADAETSVDLSQKENRTAVSGDNLFALDFGKNSTELDAEIGDKDTTGGDDGGGISGIFDTLEDVGLSLPFLEDPTQLFGLLFGERIDFIVWDIPRMSAEFGVSYKFGPIIPPVPLFVTVGGGFEIFLDLLVGYDSRGLETGDFLDGFYFGDHTFEDGKFTNEDPLELGLSVFFEATASLSVVVAEAGVTGGVSAEVGANWADDDGDGKFYLDEMYQKLQQGILCIFDFEGALEAYLEAFVKLGFDTPFGFVTLFEETFEFLRVTLLDFSVTCPPLPAPEIATVDDASDTTARLNIGAFAADRQPGATDGEEKVEIFGDRIEVGGDGVAIIDAATVRSLWTATGLADAITAGYFGDGKLTHTEAQAALAAGYLNQELDLNLDGDIDVDEIRTVLDLNNNNSGTGDSFALLIGFGEWEVFNNLTVIYGDAGAEDDQILGDADSLQVALHVFGGAGDDEIIGGLGNDVLLGGAGDDIVRGHAGDDRLYGDGAAAADITSGLTVTNNTTGIGEDVVYGGDGADLIYGGGGNDMLKGDGETEDPADSGDLADRIYGNAGEDTISGFLGNDILFGGSGADNISGGEGDDIIRGDIEFSEGASINTIKTSEANSSTGEIDLLIGGAGSDFIRGDGGNDLIFGERDGFELLSTLPSTLGDVLYGDGGDDVIRGQFGDDTIYGGDDEDLLIGGAGADSIFGNDDNDEIWGDRYPADGLAATTSEEEGNPAELGVDYIEGGDGSDRIFGGQGGDWIIGGVSNLSEYTGSDADIGDFIRGGSGDDIILGDDGTITSNTIYSTNTSGTGGDDRIYADSGDDQVAGGQGADLIFGDQSGGVGDDIIFGDEVIRDGLMLTGTYNSNDTDGSDIILGYGGSDLIVAGGDSDSAFGSVGDDLIAGDYAKILLKAGAFTTLYDSVAWVVSLDPTKGAGDRLLGQSGEDIVIGGDGDDYISGGGASDVSDDILLGDHGLVVRDDGNGEPENDIFSIFGDVGGNDEIYGGNGKDIIIGGTGDDQIYGQAMDDVILGDAGAVLRSSGVTPEVERVVSTFAELDITGIESVNLTGVGLVDLGGDAFDPVATGEDDLDGGDGSDIMLGGLGADILFGRNDSDVMLGDNGEVLYSGFGSGLLNVTTVRTIGTNGAIDAIFGESGNDVAFAGAEGDFVFGDLTAEVTREFIALGSYYTFIFNNFSAVTVGAGDDTLAGDFGQLSLVGGMPALLQSTDFASGGRDLIEGHEGNDVLIGGAEGDALHGDAAYDRIGHLVFGTTDTTGDDIIIGDSGFVNWLDGNSDPSDVDYISTLAPGIGGSDVIFGNNGNDILIGGMAGDRIYGDRTGNVDLTDMSVIDETTGSRTGSDRILGDNGFVDFVVTSDIIEGRPDYGVGSVVVDLAVGTILISTSDPIHGGNDLILGDGQSDLIFGGTGADRIWGDDGDIYALADAVTDGNDIIFGDHGKAWQTPGLLGRDAPFVGDDYFSIDTQAADLGAGDVIFGEGGDDIILGQQGDDIIFGNTGNDSLIGGHNTEGGIDDLDGLNPTQVLAILPAELRDLDPTDLQELNDIISGGEGEDVIAGDNAIIQMEGVVSSTRYQQLVDGENLYSMTTSTVSTSVGDFDVDLGFTPNIGGAIADPNALLPRNIFLLDVDAATELDAANNPNDPRVFGDDIISGGADSDEIFGQLGDDIIQGDGRIEFETVIDIDEPFNAAANGDPTFVIQNGGSNVTLSPATVLPITNGDLRALRFMVDSNVSDGDDYIEGNGGNDRIYGNLGQDDLIGGSSEFATAFAVGTGSAIRPDGADLIYGGSGDPAWLARSASYIEVADGLVGEDNFHVADADVIVGDNANIYRLDGLTFNYAQQGGTYTGYGSGSDDLQDALSVRVVELLDYEYSIDGPATNPETGTVDWKMTFNGFGVGAGDLLHGESGDDIIFGMTGDDLIYGEGGDDDLYGQAGADVIFGGRGVDGILGDDGLLSTSRNGLSEDLQGLAVANEQEIIRTPGNLQLALIYRSGLLNKSADMIAFDLDGVAFSVDGAAEPQMTSANDIIFGGWEDDFIHSGYGDDAVSGAEALPVYYSGDSTTVSGIGEVNDFLKAQQDTDVLAPVAAPDPFWYGLGLYNPGDILRFSAFDPEEFALYDENDPRSLIMVTEMVGGSEIILPFLLNNDASEGPDDLTFTMGLQTDGADHLFGDLGNDWIVGGTGRDHFFGGRGNDLLQMDDDLNTGVHNDNKKPDSYQEYADIAFDGAGRDYLILNTGADRAIAWIGEYNSFIVPFSPFGAFQIARLLQPHTEQFVLDLAHASGGDITAPDILRFAEQVAIDDKLDNPLDPNIYDDRQGSPFNELGMVRQEDFDWSEQSGSPDDPQAGNDKGPRNIMRRELWLPEDTNGSVASALAKAEADEWYLVEQAFAEAYGVDESTLELIGKLKLKGGVEVFGTLGDGETEFGVVDISTKVSVGKFGKNDTANAYTIYDLTDDSNFKFAGLDVSGKAVTIGYVENGNWIVVASVATKLRSGTDYVLSVQLDGETVTVSVDGELVVSHNFAGLVVDGGYGLAATGTQAVFQNTIVVGIPSIAIDDVTDSSEEVIGTATLASTTKLAATETTTFEETLVVWDEIATVESTTSTLTTDTTVSGNDETTAEPSLLDGGDSTTVEPTTTSTSTSETDLQLIEETTSSDPVATTEEEVVVESWAPRDDFAA